MSGKGCRIAVWTSLQSWLTLLTMDAGSC